MAIHCPHPHCGKSVQKDANGAYPSRCPHCGLLLVLQTKKPKTMSPPVTPSAKTPAGIPAKTKPPRQNTERPIPKGIPPTAKRPAAPAPVFANDSSEDSDSPFGISPVVSVTPAATSRYLQTASKRRTSTMIAIGVLAIAGAGIAFYFIKNSPEKTVSKAAEPGVVFKVADRNYSFAPPSSSWKKIERQGCDLAFVNAESNTELSLRSKEATSTPTLDSLGKDSVQRWSKDVAEVKELPTETAYLDGKLGMKAIAEGKRKDRKDRIEALVLFHEGISYQLAIEGPSANVGLGESDLTTIANHFKILGARPNWQAALAPKFDSFVSEKHPYKLRTPVRQWRRLKEADPGNRLADLRLADVKKDGLISVTPRQVPQISDVEEAYIERQKKTYKTATVTSQNSDAKVAGLEAHYLKMRAEDPDAGAFLLLVMFVKASPMVYVIECRSSAEKESDYLPIFEKIIQTWELVPEQEWAASKSGSTKPDDKASTPKSTPSEKEFATNKKETPAKKPIPEEKSSPAEQASADKKEATVGSKKIAAPARDGTHLDNEKKTDGPMKSAEKSPAEKSETDKSKKSRTLDDLDFDAPPKKESKTKDSKKESSGSKSEKKKTED